MKTILVLTDFSIRAQYAAEYAMQLAIKTKANLLLCHAMEIIESAPMADQIAWPIADHIELKKEGLAELKDAATKLEKLVSVNDLGTYKPSITCLNDFGKLSVVISRIVKNKAVDLVIMGSHKSNGLARFFFGSHTHDVLDNISCPVLLVPENLKFKGINTISYATDLTFSDLEVINYLSAIAKPFNAKIIVNHISPYGYPGIGTDNAIHHSVNELLDADHPKVFYTSVKGDNIPKRLLEISGSGKTDVMALVHKRYGFFESLFHSSVSKQLANNAKVPLLILPYSFSINVADLSNEQLEHYCFEPNESR
ncbi:MAG: universal stress protein [Sphingobacteriaceae bacterium]